MIDILFAHSYCLRRDSSPLAGPYPPLAAMYAAAHLRDHGYAVALHDTTLEESEASFALSLDRHQPNLVAIFDDVMHDPTGEKIASRREATLAMIRAARRRGLAVVVASAAADQDPGAFLTAGAGFVLFGEAEATLAALARAWIGPPRRGAAGRGSVPPSTLVVDPAEIPGLIYRDVRGVLIRTAPRSPQVQLDLLGLPAWDLVDIDLYRRHWLERQGRFSLSVSTTRGCPYRCNWCARPASGQRYAARTPASVATEWAYLAESFHPDHLWVTDDVFGLKPQWIGKLRDELIARGVDLSFTIQTRAELLPEEVVRALSEAGCEMVWLGVESGAQSMLDAMERGTSIREIEEATARLKRRGVRVGYFLQFGYPGEGWDEITATHRLIRRARPDDLAIATTRPLTGTPLLERLREAVRGKRSVGEAQGFDPMEPSLYPREFYLALAKYVEGDFRLRRGFQSLQSLGEGRTDRRADARVLLGAIRQLVLTPLQFLRVQFLRRPRANAIGLIAPTAVPRSRRTDPESVLSS